jgi:hypothetical protein
MGEMREFSSGTLKEIEDSEDVGVDGKKILEWILTKTEWEGVEWMHLPQVSDQRRGLTKTVMNLRLP